MSKATIGRIQSNRVPLNESMFSINLRRMVRNEVAEATGRDLVEEPADVRLLLARAHEVGEPDEQARDHEDDTEDHDGPEADLAAEQQPGEEPEPRGARDRGTEVAAEGRRGHHEEREGEQRDHRVTVVAPGVATPPTRRAATPPR